MKFRFVFTTSIITPEREQQYFDRISDSIRVLQNLPFEFYIVENNGVRKTLLDDIKGVQLLYTHTNANKAFSKIGIKEFHDIALLADKYDFEDDDIVVKLTGLYTLENPPTFLQTLSAFEWKYDAFLKWMHIWGGVYLYDDCILGLFALRFKYLKDFNYLEMRLHPSMEHIFAKYVRENVPNDRTAELKHLGMYFRGQKGMLV